MLPQTSSASAQLVDRTRYITFPIAHNSSTLLAICHLHQHMDMVRHDHIRIQRVFQSIIKMQHLFHLPANGRMPQPTGSATRLQKRIHPIFKTLIISRFHMFTPWLRMQLHEPLPLVLQDCQLYRRQRIVQTECYKLYFPVLMPMGEMTTPGLFHLRIHIQIGILVTLHTDSVGKCAAKVLLFSKICNYLAKNRTNRGGTLLPHAPPQNKPSGFPVSLCYTRPPLGGWMGTCGSNVPPMQRSVPAGHMLSRKAYAIRESLAAFAGGRAGATSLQGSGYPKKSIQKCVRSCVCRKKVVPLSPISYQRINLTACDLYKTMLKPCASSENSRLGA